LRQIVDRSVEGGEPPIVDFGEIDPESVGESGHQNNVSGLRSRRSISARKRARSRDGITLPCQANIR
jgi:hypothetical protein